MDFAKIAPYLHDPLILAGFVLFLLFSLFRYVISRGLIPQLSQASGYRYLRLISSFGFVLALVVIGLGFWLKHGELSEREQRQALKLLRAEVDANRQVTVSLIKNTETLLRVSKTIAEVVRTPGIPALAALFPIENLQDLDKPRGSMDMARLAVKRFADGGFVDNKLELEKMRRGAQVVQKTVDRTLPVVASLADTAHGRYKYTTATWQAHLSMLRKIDVFPVEKIERLNDSSSRLRANYDVIVVNVIRYLETVRGFMSKKVDDSDIAVTLAAERLAFSVLSAYGAELVRESESYGELLRSLDNNS